MRKDTEVEEVERGRKKGRKEKKIDQTWRLCIDYRHLNEMAIEDRFSKIDITTDYHQIRIKSQDVAKTAFQTHQRNYDFHAMPFGLSIQMLLQPFKP